MLYIQQIDYLELDLKPLESTTKIVIFWQVICMTPVISVLFSDNPLPLIQELPSHMYGHNIVKNKRNYFYANFREEPGMFGKGPFSGIL